MRYIAIILLFCLLSHPAMAQRMRDMSLPLDQTVGDQGSPNNQTTTYSVGQPPAPPAAQPYSNVPPPPPAPDTALRFMDGYCDPNFKPVVAGNMQSCLEDHRMQTCQRFASLPPEAQTVLDDAISCAHDTTASGGLDQTIGDDCLAIDARRLQLLKQYWHDQNTSYALLFLPDTITNAASRCIQGGL